MCARCRLWPAAQGLSGESARAYLPAPAFCPPRRKAAPQNASQMPHWAQTAHPLHDADRKRFARDRQILKDPGPAAPDGRAGPGQDDRALAPASAPLQGTEDFQQGDEDVQYIEVETDGQQHRIRLATMDQAARVKEHKTRKHKQRHARHHQL